MQLTIKGTVGQPSLLTWGSVQPDVSQPYTDSIKAQLVEPLFNNIQLFDGQDEITQNTVVAAIQELWFNNKIDPQLDQDLRDIYNKLTPYKFTQSNTIDDILGLEALFVCQLPAPSNNKQQFVNYTVQDDLIPSTQNLLNNWTDSNKSYMLASYYGYAKTRVFENTLFIGIKSTDDWNKYTDMVVAEAAKTNVVENNQKAQQLKLLNFASEPTQALLVSENPSAQSFEHILLSALYQAQQSLNVVPLPINTKAQIIPSTIVFINMPEFAQSSAVAITNTMNHISKVSKLNVSLKQIKSSRLRTANTIAPQHTPSTSNSKTMKILRRKEQQLSKKPLSQAQQLKKIITIVNKHLSNKTSMNTYKTQTQTFMRANRRDPFNLDIMGKSTHVTYRPDIHIILDTSGSISENNLKSSVINLISVAKRLNVDIYVSFFSTTITKPARLRVKGRSVKQIYRDYLSLPKVGGGTDFNQFWTQINIVDQICAKSGKSYRLSFVVTDFCDNVPRNRIFTKEEAAVKNTYYIPISTSPQQYKQDIIPYAKFFMKGMANKGIDISSHMIM